MQVEFAGFPCVVKKAEYLSGKRTAIELVHAQDGDSVAMATVNLPDVELAPSEVFIKSYSENEGMAECLIKAGAIGPVKRLQATGYTHVTVHECLI